MKTAMQELIVHLEMLKSRVDMVDIDSIIECANNSLEKEKEDLMKAFSDGQETLINHPTLPHYSRDEYYNDNYNQN